MAQSTNNTTQQNSTQNSKKYLIQLEGHDDMAVRDSAWYSDNKDKLFAKYPTAQIFEMADYDENDAIDTDQYAITIDGYNDASIKDSKWYNEKKDALYAKYGSKAHVKRVRYVDYWGEKAITDESAIKIAKDEISDLNNQLKGMQKGTPEYANLESQIAEKNGYLTVLQTSYDANPRVVEARAAEEAYRKNLPQELRNRIAEGRKPVYVEKGNEIFERTEDPLNLEPKKRLQELRESGRGVSRKNLLESNIESQRDMVSSMSPVDKSKREASDVLSGKTNIPIDEKTLSSSESFLDAYDYLVNNHRSIAQGTWYNIWESVSKEDYDRVHSVLQKIEDKFGNLNDISSEQIDSVLSKEEKILLESYFLLSEEEAKTSNAFKAGEGIGESLKIGAEMLLWSAITAATGGAAAPAGAAAVTASLGKGVVKVGWNVIKGLGKWAIKNGIKATIAASVAPSSHKRISKNQLQIGDDGRLMDDTGDNLKYLAENATEYFTEFSGEGIAKGLKLVGGTLENTKLATAVSKLADTPVGKFSSYIWNSKGAEIMKNLQFHGIVPELFEEFESAVINDVTGLDPEAIDTFFDKDNIGMTLMTLAPMTLIGTGVSSVSMISASRKMSSAELNLRTALSPELGNDRMNEVVNQINSASTIGEIADILDGVVSEIGAGNITKDTLKLLSDYGKAAANYKALFSGEFKKNLEVEPYADAYTLGRSLTEEDLYDVNESENQARQTAIDSGITEDILNKSSLEIVMYIEEHNDELTDESRNALTELAKAKSIKEGLNDTLKSTADNAVSSYTEIANKCSRDGILTVGMLNDKKVYIQTSREIKNGVIVKPDGVNVHMVEAVDSMTGEVILVDSKEINSITRQNLEEYNTRMGNIIRDSYLKSWTSAMNKKSVASKLSEVTQMVGQKVYINVENGGIAEVEIMQVLPDGQVLIKGKKGDLGGRAIKTVPVDSFYDSLSRDNNGILLSGQPNNTQNPAATTSQQSTVTPAQNRDYRDGVYNIVIDGVPVEVEVTGQNDASNSVVYEYTDENGRRKSNSTTIGEFQSAIDTAAQMQTNQQSDTTPAETTNQEEIAKEEIDWDNLFETDKDGYLAELQKHFGEETLDILNEEIDAAKSELEALAKAKTKNQNERMANRDKRKALEARINSLSDMVARLSAPVEEATAAPVEEQSAEQSSVTTDEGPALGEVVIPERTIVPLEKDPEPRNAIEFAARELGLKNGGIKLLVDSFKHHTGFGSAEVRKFFGLFRTKDKGGMTLEEAGERLMEMDREYNLGLFDQNDPNAGLNAILDAIGFNSTIGELRSFTSRMVQEDAQREADAAYSAWMAEYESTYGESIEETAHRNEVLQAEYEAGYALSEEQINEYNAILAEEYNQYETENNSTENKQGETGQVSGSEDIGDLPPAEGETYESGEGGNTLLQGTQSVLDSGEGIYEGAAAGSNGNNQNADTSAYGNASTGEGESVSSLEEDMPDFTHESERGPVAPNPVADPVEAAKNREKRLIGLVERNDLSNAFKRDKAYEAGKDVGDFFATYEEYEDYQAEATNFGEYNEDFERGVKASFDNRQSNELHVGEAGLEVNSEAQALALDAVMESLDGYVEVEAVSGQTANEVRQEVGATNEFMVASDKPVFISNAAFAVANIKMEKATPAQWLAMIEKNGGLKAGEDKWMGLSEWLKASDKKTLTKAEVLDFINENMIVIEEEHYDDSAEDKAADAHRGIVEVLQNKYNDYITEYHEENGYEDEYDDPASQYAIEKLREEMQDTFPYTIELVYGNEVYVTFDYEDEDEMIKWAEKTGVDYIPGQKSINSTRRSYTTDGLVNLHEIALTVPTIEPWNKGDDIHFGDAGEGRAVAWIRFGEAEVNVQDDTQQRLNEIYDRLDQLEMKVSSTGITEEEYNERARLRIERDELQEIKPKTQRVLVIDEIQSKRHQEGRDSGYKVSKEKADAEMEKFMKQMHDKYDFSSSTPFAEVFNEEEMRELARLNMQQHRATFGTTSVPDAPFDKNWHELAMKRMLRYAAENGYDVIAWTKGEQQAERYNIGDVVTSVDYRLNNDGSYHVDTMGRDGYQMEGIPTTFNSEAELAEIFGKDIARKIAGNLESDKQAIAEADKEIDELREWFSKNTKTDEADLDSLFESAINNPEQSKRWNELEVKKEEARKGHTLSETDFRIGGEGMKGFYDKMLPAFMNKYGKKWGVKVEDINLPNLENGLTMHSIPVTEEMKDSVMEGQPMFMKRPNGTVYGWTDGKKIYLTEAGFNPNTPIHEYTHLWAKAMMKNNPKGWNSVKSLLKNTPIWDEVINDPNYSSIKNNEDAVASEALSRLSGSKNAAKMEQMAQKMIDEAKGTARKLEARGLIQNMKDALAKFWNWVGTNLFGIEKFDSVEQVTDRVLWDLVNKTDLQLDTLEGSKLELSKQKKSPSVVAPTNAGYATVTPSDCAANINQLKQIYNSRNITRTEGFITNVAKSMGLTPDGPSHYRTFNTPLGEVTFRISNHNAVVSNFDERGEDKAISIVITANRNRKVKNDGNAVVKEFFYTKQGLERSTDKPLVKILDSIEDFLKTGKYIDKTGIAYPEDVNGILYRRDNVQNAAIDYLAGNARAAAIEHAVNKEASKLGVKVTYKTRSEMPKGHQNDKGYYNTKTGEIVICTENATSIADAIQTILHEAVAHKGLRQLMGNRFNEFINRVYNSLDAETKAKVDALATAHYDGNTAVAMEEYMASLAEDENFAEASAWDTIKSIFENIINSILGRNDIKIGDNELRYILRASYNNMVNPNSINTIEGWAKDTNMRNELGINEATPEILSRTGIDDISFTTAREAYETVTFNGFQEIMNSIRNAAGFKAKKQAIQTGLLKIWNEYQMENQDAQQAVIAGIEAIQRETGNMPIEDFENYLLAENQMQSRAAEEIESFLNNQFAAIVDQINYIITSVMKARGMKFKNKKHRAAVYNEVRQYLIAKHGLERNKYYQNSTGKMRDYSGLTALFGLPDTEFALAETMAQDMVDKFEAEIGDAARDDLWKKINAATRKTLRHAFESGLLSRAQHDKIRDMFDFYIPLRGFDETTAEDVYNYASYDGNRFQPVGREAHGRTSLAFDPISVIMNMAQSEIIQGNKNRVKQSLYHFIGNRPNSLLTPRECWYVLDKATGAFVEAYPDIVNGETWEQFEIRMKALEATGDAMKQKKGLDVGYRFQKRTNKDEHYIHLKINGVEHAIYVNGNPRLAEGVNGFARKKEDVIASVKKANRLSSQLFTNYNYKFGAKNFFRDFIWAQTVMLIKESPMYNLRFAVNWFANNPITIGVLMRKYKNGTLDMTNKNDVLFKEFLENGGKTGYVFIDALDRQKRRIDKAIERMSKIGNTKTNALTKAAILFQIINYANECIELSARFSTYVTSRNTKDKSGNVRSIMQSIDDAKSITTNFNRKGAQSGRGLIGGIAYLMGSWNMFYNAAVQGIQQVKGLDNNHPFKTKFFLGGWVALGFLMPYIINIFRGDDDDEIYWNLPVYERKNNICIPFGKGKVTMTVPLSPIVREGYAIGVTLSDAMFNKSVDKNATMLSMECATLLAKAFIPANPLEGVDAGLTPAENLLMFGTPDIADPIVEAVINKDWTGSPIEYRTTYNESAPHYTKVIGKDNWKERVGEKLYKAGENNLDSSFNINLSAWEHVFSSGAGGLGVFAKDMTNIIDWVTEWKAPERINEIPVVRILFSSNAMDDEKFVDKIYWDMDEVYKKKTKNIKTVYNLTEKEAYAKEEGRGEANLVKVYEAKAYPFLKRYYELNMEISKMQNDIDKMPTDTEVEKNDKVLAEQDLFNMKRDLVYELLKYEIE